MAIKTKIADIAEAIREKKKIDTKMTLAEMPDAIRSISGGSIEKEYLIGGINFIDFDGTILETWTQEQLEAAESLPDGGTHESLIFQGWNWTLEQMKRAKTELIVGALYDTEDSLTHINISIDDESRKIISIRCFANKSNTAELDWGDGSNQEIPVSQTTLTHEYDQVGEYTIKIKSNSITVKLGTVSSSPGGGMSELGDSYLIKSVYFGTTGIKNIETYCFNNLPQLETIVISNVFTYAIVARECPKLKAIISTRGAIVSNCSELKYISVPYDERISISGTGILHIAISGEETKYNGLSIKDNTNLETYTTGKTVYDGTTLSGNVNLREIEIKGDKATTIANDGFKNCQSIRKVTITGDPNSTFTIGSSAFASDKSLTEVILPDVETNIAYGAFLGCVNLKKINCENIIAFTGTNAFYNCVSLTELRFKKITDISSGTFKYCNNLKDLYFNLKIPPTLDNTDAFNGLPTDYIIHIPIGSLDTWTSATNWTALASHIAEYDFTGEAEA